MALDDTLALPFFDDGHRRFADEIARWADAKLPSLPHDDVDAACRARVKALGEAGFLKAAVPASHGGLHPALDVRTLCIAREILAFRDGLADFAFAMQGLGTGSISLFGSEELKRKYLPPVRDGKAIAAFALSEPEAGSDVAALATTAKPDGADISPRRRKNLDIERRHRRPLRGVRANRRGARRPRALGLRGRCRHAGAQGRRAHRGDRAASAGAAHIRRRAACRWRNRLGKPGEGFKVAMATLDIFRSTVGAAALGFARRALHETVEHAATRKLFGAPLGDLQMTQAAIADSATEVDAAALLVYRAAWVKDQGAARVTREAAMAKMFATEAAQRVIDRAVQLHGGAGVTQGRQGRGALPRDPRAAHLRGRDRSAEDRDCA